MMIRFVRMFIALVVIATMASIAVAQTRIRFAKGRTSTSVSSSLGKFAQRSYILGARDGQSLTATVSSRNDCIKFGMGETSMYLSTQSGDNYIDIRNDCGLTISFVLTVSINQ